MTAGGRWAGGADLHFYTHFQLLGKVKEVHILGPPHSNVPAANLGSDAARLVGAGVSEGDCDRVGQQVVQHYGRMEPQHILWQPFILLGCWLTLFCSHLRAASRDMQACTDAGMYRLALMQRCIGCTDAATVFFHCKQMIQCEKQQLLCPSTSQGLCCRA